MKHALHAATRTGLALMLGAAGALDPLQAQESSGPAPAIEAWSYRVPAIGEAQRSPSPFAVTLHDRAPEDLVCNVELAGLEQRYAWLRYGDADSTRIGVLIDWPTLDTPRLYADADRDLRIDPHERVERLADGSFELSLATATRDADGASVIAPRRVSLQLGATGSVLSMATLGFLEGHVALGNRTVPARRRDLDANGFFSDASDQLWLDLDGDGTWSPLDELFLTTPILTLGTARHAVRSSRLGSDLSFDPIEGTAHLQLALPDTEGPRATTCPDCRACSSAATAAPSPRAPSPSSFRSATTACRC